MSRRFLDRAFSQAQYREGQRQSHKRSSKQESKDSTIDDKAEPNPADLIISAYERKDYLKVLGLPFPDVDEIGNPIWNHDERSISKHYRQKCLLVHPDKNPGEKARLAFQLLSRAHKILLDEEQRNAVLKASLGIAVAEKERREATATVSEKIKINAEKIEQKRKLNKVQHEKFQSEIVRQMKERQTQNRVKRMKTTAAQENDKIEEHPDASDVEEIGFEVVRADRGRNADSDVEKLPSDRIKNKLSTRADSKISEMHPLPSEGEWRGVVLTKAKQKRKPRFMF